MNGDTIQPTSPVPLPLEDEQKETGGVEKGPDTRWVWFGISASGLCFSTPPWENDDLDFKSTEKNDYISPSFPSRFQA